MASNLWSRKSHAELNAILTGTVVPKWEPKSAKMLLEEQRVSVAARRKSKEELAKTGRELWRELFTSINTLNQLAAWENKIPAFECNCKRFYLSWKANHQPAEVNGEIPFEWKWSLKSAVNQKLGHADLTLEEARAFWSSVAFAQ